MGNTRSKPSVEGKEQNYTTMKSCSMGQIKRDSHYVKAKGDECVQWMNTASVSTYLLHPKMR